MGKASYATTIDLPTAEKGNTFSGWQRILKVDAVGAGTFTAKDLTGATITLILNKSGGSLSSAAGGGITIASGTTGTFTIDKQIITFSAGIYDYEITFTFADGSVKTYIEGTWKITD
jgi:hypothetical protein